MSFSCLIVDDEPLARRLVASHIQKIEGIRLLGECGDALEAGRLLRTKHIDIMFLDIQMPELSGLQFIRTLKNPPAIVLITAHRDHALEAFDLDVLDYLVKPVSFERFLQAVNRFLDGRISRKRRLADESPFIYLKANRKTHKVKLREIVYVESLDSYVKIHLTTAQLVTSEGINALEMSLPSEDFVRVHRSFIVNKEFVSAIGADGVELSGAQIPFGRAFKRAALAALSLKEGR